MEPAGEGSTILNSGRRRVKLRGSSPPVMEGSDARTLDPGFRLKSQALHHCRATAPHIERQRTPRREFLIAG